MTSPFEYGRELPSAELVDRHDEVQQVIDIIQNGGRLFLIGPRRFGKTSILRAAAERARDAGAVVLRYNAEAYPTLTTLAERIVADAAQHLSGPLQKVGRKVRDTFGALRPQLSYDPLTDSFSATLTAAAQERSQPALLAETLDGLNQLAASSPHPVALIIDEFQRVVEDGGHVAEGQIRAAVQAHDHVGYVFAGSKTRMLTEMTGDERRPFYRLGERRFIGAIPRSDFRPFLVAGFTQGQITLDSSGAEAILDLAEDVPYNVQRLAHACWTTHAGTSAPLSSAEVEAVLDTVVRRDDPFYTQLWNGLTRTQQKALVAVAAERGTGLYAGTVLRTYDLTSPSSMRTALKALVDQGIAREEEAQGSIRYRLEDPFFAAWLRLFVAAP
ncbi:MAG: AAA family ATPase [Bacteroidota bacterium]